MPDDWPWADWTDGGSRRHRCWHRLLTLPRPRNMRNETDLNFLECGKTSFFQWVTFSNEVTPTPNERR